MSGEKPTFKAPPGQPAASPLSNAVNHAPTGSGAAPMTVRQRPFVAFGYQQEMLDRLCRDPRCERKIVNMVKRRRGPPEP